jgi:diguanylate cyclase (GGDEF)-like protein
MGSTVTEQAVAALERYLAAEAQRDLRGMVALHAQDVCAFGTGVDEVVVNGGEFERMLARQLAELTAPMESKLDVLRTIELGADACVIMSIVTIRIFLPAGEETMAVRITFVMHRVPDGWRVAHLHASMPWTMQRAGESFPNYELEERNRRLEQLVGERTRELADALEQVQLLATTDKLTGVHNRARLDEFLADEHRYQQRHARPASIALLDIDHFKTVNDTHGHLIGDIVLRDVARALAASVREIDRVGRWGGEEFLVLMPDASAEQALRVAERIRTHITDSARHPSGSITVSIGVAQYRPGEAVHGWLARADRVLYEAKAAGRDRTVVDR